MIVAHDALVPLKMSSPHKYDETDYESNLLANPIERSSREPETGH